jgi:FdhD protein
LLREIEILDEYGERRSIHIPAERPLTVFVDKRELVTLMTLGACPSCWCWATCATSAWSARAEVESVTVDWDVGAAAVRTRAGIADIEASARRGASSPPAAARARCSAM